MGPGWKSTCHPWSGSVNAPVMQTSQNSYFTSFPPWHGLVSYSRHAPAFSLRDDDLANTGRMAALVLWQNLVSISPETLATLRGRYSVVSLQCSDWTTRGHHLAHRIERKLCPVSRFWCVHYIRTINQCYLHMPFELFIINVKASTQCLLIKWNDNKNWQKLTLSGTSS